MMNSVILDVAIGMVFVYLLLSLIASVVQEILSSFMQLRAANLLRGMRSLFSGETLWGRDIVDSIYNHGLVRGLFSDPKHDSAERIGTVAGPSPQATAAAAAKAAEAAARTASDKAAATTTTGADPTAGGAATTPPKFVESGARPLDFLRNGMRWAIGIRTARPVEGVSNQLLLPSYIPSRTFALALIDLLNKDKTKTGDDALKSIITSLADHQADGEKANRAGQAIYALALDAANAKNSMAAFQVNLEGWYNDAMDRVSGWYKRYTQSMLLVIGLIIAASLNVSTVRVAQTLWFSKDTRDAMTKAADSYLTAHPNPPTASADAGKVAAPAQGSATTQGGATVENKPADTSKDKASVPGDLKKKLEESTTAFTDVSSKALLPVGWKSSLSTYWCEWKKEGRDGTWKVFEWFAGWLITACAISLGAPFWFDLLNKFMVVRSTVKPQEKSQSETSKD
jgi:hypothetical protein